MTVGDAFVGWVGMGASLIPAAACFKEKGTMKAKQWSRWVLVLLLAVASTWMLTGCKDDDDEDAPAAGAAGPAGSTGATGAAGAPGAPGAGAGAAPAAVAADVDIAGVWNGTRSSAGGSAPLQFFFVQNNGVLSGQYQDTSGFKGNLTGEIDGDDIQFVVALTAGTPGATWTFTGAANATGTQLTGKMNTGAGLDNIQASR
jgi:hypothetical protein